VALRYIKMQLFLPRIVAVSSTNRLANKYIDTPNYKSISFMEYSEEFIKLFVN